MKSKKLPAFVIATLASILCGHVATAQIVQVATAPAVSGDRGKPADYEATMKTSNQIYTRLYAGFSSKLPISFDWRDSGMVTPPKNQGAAGTCWAHTTAGVLESKVAMMGNGLNDFSEQQLVNCIPSMGTGGGSMAALKFYFTSGPMSETCATYTASNGSCADLSGCAEQDFRDTGYYTVDTNNIEDVKTSIYEDGPAYFRFDIWDDFGPFWRNAAAGDVYVNDATASDTGGGHAVLIIGWDDEKEAWLCKNSWGEFSGPGADGTFWISYGDHANNINLGMGNVESSAGYELSWDHERVGHETHWTFEDAIDNCVWNLNEYPNKHITCSFDGEIFYSGDDAAVHGYELYWDGKRIGYEPFWSKQGAVLNCNWNRNRYPNKDVACYFDGIQLHSDDGGQGYELFYNHRRVGHETGWSLSTAKSNCRRNAEKYPNIHVRCVYDGEVFFSGKDDDSNGFGYELFWNYERAGYEPFWTESQAVSNCRWNRERYPNKIITCFYNGRFID